jgi:hypothetical protein
LQQLLCYVPSGLPPEGRGPFVFWQHVSSQGRIVIFGTSGGCYTSNHYSRRE